MRPPKGFIPFLAAALIVSACATAGARSVARLTIWSHQRHMEDLTLELVERFNNTDGRAKGIQVSVRTVGDDSYDLFSQAQARGEGPDLFSEGFLSSGTVDLLASGDVAWFNDLPGFDDWMKQWPSWYWVEGLTTFKGKVYDIPAQVVNARLIYNRDLFRAIGRDPDDPPRSYAELREIAREITKQSGGRAFGFAYPAADNWPVPWMPMQWAEANGEPAYWDWKTGKWDFDGYNRVFQLILDLQADGSLFPGAVKLNNDALRAQFSEGRIGMFMGEAWDVGVLNDQFPAKCDWGVAPLPTYDGNFHGKPEAKVLGGLWLINGQTKHKNEAWEVVKWFSRYEIRALFYERGKIIDPDPVVTSEYVKTLPDVHGFREFADTLDHDYLTTGPVLPGWAQPDDNPCSVLRQCLLDGSDLSGELTKTEDLWNQALDSYFLEHQDIKRAWSIYPDFDGTTGVMGPPLESPVFQPSPS